MQGSMRRPLRSRLFTLLVAALLFGGAGGAADLDALVFHGRDAGAAAASPHFEAAGRTGHHADQCLLALRLASGTRATPSLLPGRAEALPARGAARRPVTAPDRFYPGLHQDSRAPPSVLA